MTPGGRSPRQRGDYFERQTRAALRAQGWVVNRSAGSLGDADLWALRADKTPMMVSCKLSGRIGPAERNALLEACRLAGARAVVAMRPRAGRVLILAVIPGAARCVPLETLPVPPRTDPRVGMRRRHDDHDDADHVGAVPDTLTPAGVQLSIPLD